MRNSPGYCLLFTGPSGAGKSTVTAHVVPILEAHGRTVTVLDVVPELAKHWGERTSEGKLLRKAFVAREVIRHGGIAICVTASGRGHARDRVRQIVGTDSCVEVFFDAPDNVTAKRRAARSKKTPLLKKVRRAVRRIRGVGRRSQTYQRPESPDLTVTSIGSLPEEVAADVIQLLVDRGWIESDTDVREPGVTSTTGADEPVLPG